MLERSLQEEEREKLLRELERVQREFDEFACAVAHDLRTPLRHIETFAQLLKSGAEKHGFAEQGFIQGLFGALAEARQLLEVLLQVCRITTTSVNKQRVDLREITLSILARLEQGALRRKVKVIFDGELSVMTDPRLVYIVLHGFLNKAWKFSRSSAEVVIEVGERLCGSNRVFYVRQRGSAFWSERGRKVFDPCAAAWKKGQFEHPGLELALVKRALAKLGGELWTESTPHHEPCFYFSLG